MSYGWINTDNMMRDLQKQMNAQMAEAAEPIIRKAVEAAEAEMRKRLGAMVISLIESSFSVERFGHDIRILVHQPQRVEK